MSTSESRNNAIICKRYLVAAIVCAVFATVYEIFARGVISFWMIGMPLFPLVLGVLPSFVLHKKGVQAPDWAVQTWNCGVITLTVGSLLNGIFEIFGTYLDQFLVFMVCGIALLICGLTIFIIKRGK